MQSHPHEVSPERADFRQLRLRCDRRAARRTRAWLAGMGLSRDHPAVLLAHELVTNSVKHSPARHLWLTVLEVPEGLRIEVVDDGGGKPEPQQPGALATSGRGLRWVEALSDHWGVARGKLTHVWFQVRRSTRDR